MPFAASKAVYKVSSPQLESSESYTCYAEALANPTDPYRCWIVKEKHRYWDERGMVKGQCKVDTLTLHANGCINGMSIQEARKLIDRQVLLRARQGFKYLFTNDYSHSPFYSRYVIHPDGVALELPHKHIGELKHPQDNTTNRPNNA